MTKKINSSQFTESTEVVALSKYSFDRAFELGIYKTSHRYRLIREKINPHDPNAVLVYIDRLKIGYLPRHMAKPVAHAIDNGDAYSVKYKYAVKGDDYDKKYDNDYSDGYYRRLELDITNESAYSRALGIGMTQEEYNILMTLPSGAAVHNDEPSGCGCIAPVVIGAIALLVLSILGKVLSVL